MYDVDVDGRKMKGTVDCCYQERQHALVEATWGRYPSSGTKTQDGLKEVGMVKRCFLKRLRDVGEGLRCSRNEAKHSVRGCLTLKSAEGLRSKTHVDDAYRQSVLVLHVQLLPPLRIPRLPLDSRLMGQTQWPNHPGYCSPVEQQRAQCCSSDPKEHQQASKTVTIHGARSNMPG